MDVKLVPVKRRASGKGSRKVGRAIKKCLRYKNEGIRDKNKRRKLKKSVKRINKKSAENVIRINKIGRGIAGEDRRKKQKYNIKVEKNANSSNS